MTVLAFDGRTGASGDMLLGALVGAGADPDALSPVTDALDVTYDVERVTRSGLRATKVTVRHTGDHDHSHDHAEGHGPHRPYPEVVDIVEEMALPDAVTDRALSAFERLGRAEAAAHGTDLSETAFHEVGADDAIADVVGTALLVADLDPDRIVTTPVALGGGETEFSHGSYPVPVPAVTEILDAADFATRGGPEDVELLTPTGAALLAEFAAGVTHLPTFDVEASGYGAGGHDFADRPNVLRALVGTEQGGLTDEDVVVLETNLDDATPEVLGDLQESLAAAGARDVSVAPLTMKKSRPGHLVKALARPADAERVARRLARETGTLGVRATPATHRWVAERTVETATVKIEDHTHEVDVKVATDDAGDVYDVSAEYDDAATVARETGLPVRDVMRRAEEKIRQ